MIPNLSYPIPTIGRITIGEVFEDEKGRRLPRRLNFFRITAQHKRDGAWVEHPIAKAVLSKQGVEPDKLTSIPVKVIVNDPDLIVRERYEAYTKEGRILCAGNGQTAKRLTDGKIEQVACPGAEKCEFGIGNRCDLMVRANFQIDVESEDPKYTDDELSTFILRSGGINTARTLNRKLHYLAKMFGNRLVGVPLTLKLRCKAGAQSRWTPFYYVDILPAVSLKQAAAMAKKEAEDREAIGIDQASFEAEIRNGLENGPFEDGQEAFEEMEDLLLGRFAEVEGDEEGSAKQDADGKKQGGALESTAKESLEALRSHLNAIADQESSAA